jgi:large subunit ribosomal protein L23
MNHIIKAVVTEKSMRLAEVNKYTFHVSSRSNKFEIAADCKRLFKVDPIGVQIINVKGKIKSYRRHSGVRPDIHKAIITLDKKQKIKEYSLGESNAS